MSIIPDDQPKSELDQTQANNRIIEGPSSSKHLHLQIYKDVVILGMAFLLQYSGFFGIGNLESSLNTAGNVGVNSLFITYSCAVVSSIFLPHAVIALLGNKWTLVIGQVSYLLYVAANYYPKAYLMYPAAVLVGIGYALLWTSQSNYLTNVGTFYAQATHKDITIILNRFFGIFYMFYQSSQIWGNLISYLVLQPNENGYGNETTNNTTAKYDKCGADFSQQEYTSAGVTNEIDQKTVDILSIVYICLCICSILIVIIFLTQRREASRDKTSVMLRNSVKLLLSTVKHLRQINQLLLIPLNIWIGLEQAFISAQFTKGFVTCTLNAKYVGIVMVAYGASDAVSSLAFSQIVKIIGRWPCLITAALINYSLIITMFIWRPSEDQTAVIFVLAALWGTSDGVWQSQVYAFCAEIFVNNEEAAFSNYSVWQAIGFTIVYVITPVIRIRNALIILVIFLSLGMCGYGFIEYRLRKSRKQASSNNKVSPS